MWSGGCDSGGVTDHRVYHNATPRSAGVAPRIGRGIVLQTWLPLWRLAALAPLAFVGACHDLEAAPASTVAWARNLGPISLPVPSRARQVGRVMVVWTDTSRQRALPVWVYYPAISTDTAAVPLLPDPAWTEVHRRELVAKFGPAGNALAAVKTHAVSGAPLESSGHRVPVVIFAPDHGWLPTDYSAIIEGLASRGFAVVTFAPPGDGGAIRLPDGTVEPVGTEVSCERVATDMTFIAGQLAALDRQPGWSLAGALDLRHVAVAGVGTGGSAALLAAAHDPALFAAASLDGDFFNGSGDGTAHQPLLYLSTEPPGTDSLPASQWGEVDRAERRRDQRWAETASHSVHAVRIQVARLYRGNLVDAALIPANALPLTLNERRVGSLPPVAGFVMVESAVAAFLNDRIVGDGAGLAAVQATYAELLVDR